MPELPQYPFDQLPSEAPPCLQPETLANACVDCPRVAQGCGYLALAQELTDRIHDLRQDILIPQTLTPEGLLDVLKHDKNLGQEFIAGNFGVIRLDGRFVGHINTYGNRFGDAFLAESGRRIYHVARLQTRNDPNRQPAKNQQFTMAADTPNKLDYPALLDIVCRQGGDEFAIIVRHVDADTLRRVANRVGVQLDVNSAIRRYEAGEIPFIASVGIAHGSEVRAAERRKLVESGQAYELFARINGSADEGQKIDKERQYGQMWAITHHYLPEDIAEQYQQMPTSSREIADLFLKYVCPDFYNAPRSYLGHPEQ